MGMYNEVFKKCPRCGGKGYMQVHQIVLGFGEFDLDRPETMEKLSVADLHELHAAVSNRNEHFSCEACNNWFTLDQANGEDTVQERHELIRKLFGGAE